MFFNSVSFFVFFAVFYAIFLAVGRKYKWFVFFGRELDILRFIWRLLSFTAVIFDRDRFLSCAGHPQNRAAVKKTGNPVVIDRCQYRGAVIFQIRGFFY